MRIDESRLTAAYLLANRKHGTLYLGSALDLIQRVHEHRAGVGSAFTQRCGVHRLVWHEPFMLVVEARGFNPGHEPHDNPIFLAPAIVAS